MRIVKLATILLPVCLLTSPALALEVKKSVDINGTAATAWQAIGDFCAIAEWHPVVATCEESEEGGATFRTLTTADGAVLYEKLLDHSDDAMSYTYEIVDSPLPVAGYVSTLKARTVGYGAAIDWTGQFEAAGASDQEAVDAIGGIYGAGLAALEKALR
jgi:hypothetical protein